MRQAEKIFMISDAARQVEVEAHVLRYWEEELQLPVKRNEMGHRYYTYEDIKLFRNIKEWKEQGLQLKAIRNMLKHGAWKESALMFDTGRPQEDRTEELVKHSDEMGGPDLARRHVIMVKKGEVLQSSMAALPEESREQKSLRLQQLLREMIAQAVQSNNQELCREIKESLLKELDYQFRIQEEKEDEREMQRVCRQEEHYRQIDELIRSYNTGGKRKDKKEVGEKRKQSKKNGFKELHAKQEEERVHVATEELEMNGEELEMNGEELKMNGEMSEMSGGMKREADTCQQAEIKRKKRILSGRIKETGSAKDQNKEAEVKKGIFLKRKRSIV